MKLLSLELNGFKSFGKKSTLEFRDSVTAVVGPNGSGKSNVVEGIRFALGEQSMKSLRGKSGIDLIFAGSKMIPKGSRAKATLTFDNKDKTFKLTGGKDTVNVDFDQVSITREVASDGTNTYLINGMEVRLKDVHELLSSIHIGSSSHHIISQGEADRLLSSSAKDRREMIEDALGLKVYQYRLKESERKLEKAELHLKEVASLRRELAPHLNFLKKQVEKIEKARELRVDLSDRYARYLAYEALFIENEGKEIETKKDIVLRDIHTTDEQLAEYARPVSNPTLQKLNDERVLHEKELALIQSGISETERALGRLEGRLEAERARYNQPQKTIEKSTLVARIEVENTFSQLRTILSSVKNSSDMSEVRSFIEQAQAIIDGFSPEEKAPLPIEINEEELRSVETLFSQTLETLSKLKSDEINRRHNLDAVRKMIDDEKAKDQNRDRHFYELKNTREHLSGEESLLRMREESHKNLVIRFEEEIREGSILIGSEIFKYKNFSVEEISEMRDRTSQEEERKAIERIKIKLEEAGGGGADVVQEFEETKSRDEFLSREVIDAENSKRALLDIIHDLRVTLDTEFRVGIQKINDQFQDFFTLMFGGGTAFLSLVAADKKKIRKGEEDEDFEIEDEEGIDHGVEITVSLPRKKVKDLHMLSGGERSLTSIALLFAISQVNPPPFLVLDETDAALDEANSKKYGDMIERLASYSQLIVVTHNRETMSRARTLYGVTVGADGASKLLSVKFDDAAQYAK